RVRPWTYVRCRPNDRAAAANRARAVEAIAMNRLLAALAAFGATAQAPAVHEMPLSPDHVHWGYYDARVKPAIRIASGDRIGVETMAAGGLPRLILAGATDAEIPASLKAVERQVTERGPGAHPMSGPIFVEGAEPGDTLEVRILAIEFLHPFGVVAFN